MRKKLGAAPAELPRVFWVKMLSRPHTEDPKLKQVWKLRRKFNDQLVRLLQEEDKMHWISITKVNEFTHFDTFGNLTTLGQRQFWSEFNQQIKTFDVGLLINSILNEVQETATFRDKNYRRSNKIQPQAARRYSTSRSISCSRSASPDSMKCSFRHHNNRFHEPLRYHHTSPSTYRRRLPTPPSRGSRIQRKHSPPVKHRSSKHSRQYYKDY